MIELFASLLSSDISVWIAAKSSSVERIGEHTRKIAVWFLGKDKKQTKMHYIIPALNTVLVLIVIVVECVNYFDGKDNYLQSLVEGFGLLKQNTTSILLEGAIIAALTFVFMALTYRAVNISPVKDDADGNRRLNVAQLDESYIEFTKLHSVDTRSTLFLIAGDLSFLGVIPDVRNLAKPEVKESCKKMLSENSKPHKICTRKCPLGTIGCMEKSKQFIQLLQLRNKPIYVNIICKKPTVLGDIDYKRRLGRLKEVYGDYLNIHFISDDTLSGQICTLGRIKVNGGRSEMLWHWKDPDYDGYYTAPKIKKDTSGESKTLIYLIRDVLWNSSDSIDENLMNECIEEYKRALEGTDDG